MKIFVLASLLINSVAFARTVTCVGKTDPTIKWVGNIEIAESNSPADAGIEMATYTVGATTNQFFFQDVTKKETITGAYVSWDLYGVNEDGLFLVNLPAYYLANVGFLPKNWKTRIVLQSPVLSLSVEGVCNAE